MIVAHIHSTSHSMMCMHAHGVHTSKVCMCMFEFVQVFENETCAFLPEAWLHWRGMAHVGQVLCFRARHVLGVDCAQRGILGYGKCCVRPNLSMCLSCAVGTCCALLTIDVQAPDVVVLCSHESCAWPCHVLQHTTYFLCQCLCLFA